METSLTASGSSPDGSNGQLHGTVPDSAQKATPDFTPVATVQHDGAADEPVSELPLEAIDLDKHVLARDADPRHVRFLELLIRDGVELQPVVVFADGDRKWLSDGLHRFTATRQLGQTTIRAYVRRGSRRDATLFAIKSNVKHGKRLTKAQQKANLTKLWELYPDLRELSCKGLEDLCGLSANTISGLKKEHGFANREVIDRRGRKMNTTGIGQGGGKGGGGEPAAGRPQPRTPAAAPPEPALPGLPGEAEDAFADLDEDPHEDSDPAAAREAKKRAGRLEKAMLAMLDVQPRDGATLGKEWVERLRKLAEDLDHRLHEFLTE